MANFVRPFEWMGHRSCRFRPLWLYSTAKIKFIVKKKNEICVNHSIFLQFPNSQKSMVPKITGKVFIKTQLWWHRCCVSAVSASEKNEEKLFLAESSDKSDQWYNSFWKEIIQNENEAGSFLCHFLDNSPNKSSIWLY